MNNITSLWVNVARAFEISSLGNFNLKVTLDPDYSQGLQDYQTIKSFYNLNFFDNRISLFVEAHKPTNYQSNIKEIELIEILQRVELAKKNPKPSLELSTVSQVLLNTASERLNFGFEVSQDIVEISAVIAQLENSNKIDTCHIAEAIQFKHFSDYYIIAEDATLNFGNGISISKFNLDAENVSKAIQFLQSLI